MNLICKLSTMLVIMGVFACAQTSSTKSTSSQQQKTQPTSPSADPLSPRAAESETQESQTEATSGAETSAETTASQNKDLGAPTAAETEASKYEQKPSTGKVFEPQSAEAQLEQAKENLRVSQETEKRIAAELEQLKASGSASPEAVRDYETYRASVAAMTAENRKILEQMEAAYANQTYAASGPHQDSAKIQGGFVDPAIAEEQALDDVEMLDRQLNASLAKFDGQLLEEMDQIRAGSSKKLQDLAEEAAEAAKRLREQGLDVDTSGKKSSEAGRDGTDIATKEGSRKGGEGQSGRDQRRVQYEDDDIVARQLREAAENETDPELKEKLWKEYEEYKKSR